VTLIKCFLEYIYRITLICSVECVIIYKEEQVFGYAEGLF